MEFKRNTAPPEPARRTHFVQPGDVLVTEHDDLIQTVLGSCVSVVIWDPALKVGGMNHFALAGHPAPDDPIPHRFSENAMHALAVRMDRISPNRSQWLAYVVGGAAQLSKSSYPIGARNVTAAKAWLHRHRIRIKFQDVGGNRGRKLQFFPREGKINIFEIGRTHSDP